MRNVRVTFTATDKEDSGEEMDNAELVASWSTFLDEAFEDFQIEDIAVEKVEELSRVADESADEEETS
jgi:hypothetical protein